jgi:hypothetical protein
MIAQSPTATNPRLRRPRRAGAGIFCLALLVASCGGDDSAVDPDDRLCNGEGGLGVSVQGRADPLEFCVDDADVSVLLTSLNRYDIAAQMDTPDGVIQLRLVFAQRDDFPVSLAPVPTIGEATSDPGNVWIYYEEIPGGGDAIESLEVTGGSFRLSFSDEDVLAGTLSGITLTMHDVDSGDGAGSRRLAEGFFSLSVKDPAAAAAGP